MAWPTVLVDLRTLLADTDRDNLVKDKEVFGPIDGANTHFYTFDDRLLTSGVQTNVSRPLRVWIDTQNSGPTEFAASGITVVDPYRGEFTLTVAPSGYPCRMTASYYFQQHLDSELNTYLQQACNLVNIDVVDNTPTGLQMAVLNIAGSLAHQRLSQRIQHDKSDQFMLHENPQLAAAVQSKVQFHRGTAEYLYNMGMQMRRNYYDLRNDRGRAPAFGLLKRMPAPRTPHN